MDTRERLIADAEILVRRRGYDAFSFADLAASAGIRKASVHYHFPTKADLAVDLMRSYTKRTFEAFADLSAMSAAEGLHRIIGLYRDALGDGGTLCLCVAFSLGRESLTGAARAEVGVFQSRMIDLLQAVFERGLADGCIRSVGDPRAEAVSAFALLEGAQLAARAGDDVDLFHTATWALRARLSQG